ncbi:MAG: BON domain-containing protein [Gammaproteobacteria bacterium]|nr:BON domain-containing protein [Gammaproteobacteria bacterium]
MNKPHPSRTWLLLTTLLIVLVGCAGTSTRESTGEYIDDGAITTKVKSAFVSDPQVNALSINVTTFKGTVQLSGFADSQQAIDRAVELARKVEGVKAVKNDILRTPESTGEYLDDSVITTKVKSAFVADRQVSALDIRVETVKGVVRLNGFADTPQEIDRATALALQVKNVKSVMNNIQLRQSSRNGS